MLYQAPRALKSGGSKKVGGGLNLIKSGFTGSLLLNIWHFLQKGGGAKGPSCSTVPVCDLTLQNGVEAWRQSGKKILPMERFR